MNNARAYFYRSALEEQVTQPHKEAGGRQSNRMPVCLCGSISAMQQSSSDYCIFLKWREVRLHNKLGFGSIPTPQLSHTALGAPVPPSPMRLPLKKEGNDAAFLQRIASAESGNSGNPLHPAAPDEQPRDQACRTAGGPGGKRLFRFPPGGFAPLSTRESGFQATDQLRKKRKNKIIPPTPNFQSKRKQRHALSSFR